MKKLIVVFGLAIASSMYAMELTKISENNTKSFFMHLTMAVCYGDKVIKEDKITENNSIYKMLFELHDNLVQKHSENIKKMVESDSDLQARINEFSVVNFNELVQFPLKQIRQQVADVKGAQAYLIRTRQILAGLNFVKKQPTYSNAWINEVGTEDRIGFMVRNEKYGLDKNLKLDENAKKDYWSLFIYQALIAPIID